MTSANIPILTISSDHTFKSQKYKIVLFAVGSTILLSYNLGILDFFKKNIFLSEKEYSASKLNFMKWWSIEDNKHSINIIKELNNFI